VERGRQLLQRVTRGEAPTLHDECKSWAEQNRRLLDFLATCDHAPQTHLRITSRRILDAPTDALARDFAGEIARQLHQLESLQQRLAIWDVMMEQPETIGEGWPSGRDRVFVVYGRNEVAKEKVARFLGTLGLEPILLDEQAARGQTLIEKLEANSSTTFAVVLLTADDVGALSSSVPDVRPRARQNVIFELGFTCGRLGRSRVCALYEDGIELPSDLGGLECQALDPAGGWKLRLARELYDAGLRFDVVKALGSSG
jgi:predicted nucleotide-binding protein